jgi:hypothetical protein
MTLINHAGYQPTPQDMMLALKAIADIVEQVTETVPNIMVGSHKLYPPNDGKPLDAKGAQATYAALYEGKGTITVKDKNVPVFKQSNGPIVKDDLKLETKLAPSIPSPENDLAKKKYQELLEKHPDSVSLPPLTDEERLKDTASMQKFTDLMVFESAIKEGVPPEAFSRVMAQGSAYISSNLQNTVGDSPEVPEGIQYLANMETEYRTQSLASAIELEIPIIDAQAISTEDLPTQSPFAIYTPPQEVPDLSDRPLAIAYAEMDLVGRELNDLNERSQTPGYEYLMASGTTENPSQADKLKQQFESVKTSYEARLAKINPEPAPLEKTGKSLTHNEEPDNWDEILIARGEARDEVDLAEWEDSEDNPENYEPVPDYLPEKEPSLPTLQTISSDLTLDQRFAPGPHTTEQLQATIAQLTSKIESLQSEVESIRKTMDKFANKEPVVKVRNWAKDKLEKVVNKIQDRAKVDLVRTVNYGRDLAQKAMDEIGKTAGMFESSMLKVDDVGKDIKTMISDIHDNAPIVEVAGGYTFNNEGSKITVDHKDRGKVFEVGDKGASFKGKFNAEDYKMLSNLKNTVEVLAGPVAIAAEMAKDLVVGTVKEEGKKAAVKL